MFHSITVFTVLFDQIGAALVFELLNGSVYDSTPIMSSYKCKKKNVGKNASDIVWCHFFITLNIFWHL